MGLTGLHGTHGDTWGLMGYPNGPLRGGPLGAPVGTLRTPVGTP